MRAGRRSERHAPTDDRCTHPADDDHAERTIWARCGDVPSEADIAALALAENAYTEASPTEITEQIAEVISLMMERLNRIEAKLEGDDDDAGRQDERGGRLQASARSGGGWRCRNRFRPTSCGTLRLTLRL
jgi:hypothetical protein